MIDVVYVVYGCGQYTLLSLQHLQATTPINRVILVDNAPEDLTLSHKRLKAILGDRFEYIPQDNIGVYPALNMALEQTNTRHVLIASSDAFVGTGWFAPTYHYVTEGGYGWLGPMEVNTPEYDPDVFWQWLLDVYPTTIANGRAPSCHGLLDWHRVRDTMGGFDPQFFLTYGDTDFIERLNDSGIPYGTMNPPRVLHLVQQQRRLITSEQNMVCEMMDENLFHEKWKDRVDVMERHPRYSDYETRLACRKYMNDAEV